MRVMLTRHANYVHSLNRPVVVEEVERRVVVKTSARFFVTDLMEWKVSPMIVARCEEGGYEGYHPKNNNLVETNG